MTDPFDSFLPDPDPAVLEFARYCIMHEIMSSPDGQRRLEELARDPDGYVRDRCQALFAALRAEADVERNGRGAPGSNGGGVPDRDERHDPFDLDDPDGYDPDDEPREISPSALRITGADLHRLAVELAKEAPSISMALRSGRSDVPGPKPPRIRLSNRTAKSRIIRTLPSRPPRRRIPFHSRRWLETFGKPGEGGKDK